jgi:hypothetical protein
MPTDEEAVLELEAARVAAMNVSDPEALLQLLHDDHVHVLANGVATDKRGAAESLRMVPRRVEMLPPKVRIYDEVAVLTGPQVNHEQIKGETVRVELYVTRVARRIEGVWKFVSMHATFMPPKP